MSPDDETQQPSVTTTTPHRHDISSSVHGLAASSPEDESQQTTVTVQDVFDQADPFRPNPIPDQGQENLSVHDDVPDPSSVDSSGPNPRILLSMLSAHESPEESLRWTQPLNSVATISQSVSDIRATEQHTSVEAVQNGEMRLPTSSAATSELEARYFDLTGGSGADLDIKRTPGPATSSPPSKSSGIQRELERDLESLESGHDFPHIQSPVDLPNPTVNNIETTPGSKSMAATTETHAEDAQANTMTPKRMHNLTDLSPIKGPKSKSVPSKVKLPPPRVVKPDPTTDTNVAVGDNWMGEDSFAGPGVAPSKKPIDRFNSIMLSISRPEDTEMDVESFEQTDIDQESYIPQRDSGSSRDVGSDRKGDGRNSLESLGNNGNVGADEDLIPSEQIAAPDDGHLPPIGSFIDSERGTPPSPQRHVVPTSSPQAQPRSMSRNFAALASSGNSPQTHDVQPFSSFGVESIADKESSPIPDLFQATQLVQTLERTTTIPPVAPTILRTVSLVSVSSNGSKVNIPESRRLVRRPKHAPTPIAQSAPAQRDRRSPRRNSPQIASAPAEIAQDTYVDEPDRQATSHVVADEVDSSDIPLGTPPCATSPVVKSATPDDKFSSRPARNRSAPKRFTPTKSVPTPGLMPKAGISRAKIADKKVADRTSPCIDGTLLGPGSSPAMVLKGPDSKQVGNGKRKRSPSTPLSEVESEATIPDPDDETFRPPSKQTKKVRNEIRHAVEPRGGLSRPKPVITGPSKKKKAKADSWEAKRIRVARSGTKENSPLTTPTTSTSIRVLALWPGSGAYWIGTIASRKGASLHVLFDDNTRRLIGIQHLRVLMLRRGETVRKLKNGDDWVVAEDYDGQSEGVRVSKNDDEQVLLPTKEVYIPREYIETHFVDRLMTVNDFAEVPDTSSANPAKVSVNSTKPQTFADLTFMITGLVNPSNEHPLLKAITERGGSVVDDWTDLFDFPDSLSLEGVALKQGIRPFQICDDGKKESMTPKVMISLAWGIPILDAQYIYDASERGIHWSSYLISFESHYLQRPVSQHIDSCWASTDSAKGVSQRLRKPFKGKRFLFHELRNGSRKKPSKGSLVDITQLVPCCLYGLGASSFAAVGSFKDIPPSSYDFIIVDHRLGNVTDEVRTLRDVGDVEWLKQCLIMGAALPPTLSKT